MENIKASFLANNQVVIRTDKGRYFQSYNTIIAFVPNSGTVQLDAEKWDYSATTRRYRNQFLNETTKETLAKIKSGEIILSKLN